jgi:hypothetical protein
MKFCHAILVAGAAAGFLVLVTAQCARCGNVTPPAPDAARVTTATVVVPPDAPPTAVACDATIPAPAPASTLINIKPEPLDAGRARCAEQSEVVRAYVVLQRPCGG